MRPAAASMGFGLAGDAFDPAELRARLWGLEAPQGSRGEIYGEDEIYGS